jgi:hypothetical protein
MNWLLNKLANEKTYYPIFMGALCLYAFLACILVNWAVGVYPNRIARIIFLLFVGAVGLAFGGRVVNSLAYAKVNKSREE